MWYCIFVNIGNFILAHRMFHFYFLTLQSDVKSIPNLDFEFINVGNLKSMNFNEFYDIESGPLGRFGDSRYALHWVKLLVKLFAKACPATRMQRADSGWNLDRPKKPFHEPTRCHKDCRLTRYWNTSMTNGGLFFSIPCSSKAQLHLACRGAMPP